VAPVGLVASVTVAVQLSPEVEDITTFIFEETLVPTGVRRGFQPAHVRVPGQMVVGDGSTSQCQRNIPRVDPAKEGRQVETADGKYGNIDEVFVDPESGRDAVRHIKGVTVRNASILSDW
jgi:hypothetical protein